MKISIGICTWNRAKLLDQTLEELCKLIVPADVDWEVLVVNNACTDETDQVIARHKTRLPLRRLYEPTPGHSHARNCAVEHARGELLIWTDDDVLVDKNWVIEYTKAEMDYPNATYFGGTIEPWFERPPPEWIRKNLKRLGSAFAIRQLGEETRSFTAGEDLYGANCAFRLDVLRRYRFDTRLGRKGKNMLSGDETELVARLAADGHSGVWVGSAKVRHFIPVSRLNEDYIFRFYEGIGRTQYRCLPPSPAAKLFGAPRWAFRKYWAARLKAMLLKFTHRTGWLDNALEAAVCRGIIAESRLDAIE